MRVLYILFFLLITQIFCVSQAKAADFQTSYKVDYYLIEDNGAPKVKVKLKVDIKSFTSQSYIKKFSLSFPKYFTITNPTALYNEPLTPIITQTDNATKIDLEFPQEISGKDATTTIYLEFEQEHLFTVDGTIWEVTLPTLQLDKDTDYIIALHLPEQSTKKISISKPVPDSVTDSTIIWKSPKIKTIYAVFGDQQYYNLDLQYHLQNTQSNSVYTEVAFPPDSLYQKIYLNSIKPVPDSIHIDEDGNYIGRYTLQPKEQKDVIFKGIAQINSKPRTELQNYSRKQFDSQKKYLLNSNKFWKLNLQTNLEGVKDIYNYVVSAFQYDESQINSKKERLGAMKALQQPDKVVCTEFTDTFIALARQKNIYSREIEGYGYSRDPELRPLSLKSDILHSWPEYYDSSANRWLPLDPTWQNTSGIDYLSSFDLNHIVFAIHGKDPQYPLPAGMYKVSDTKDVAVVTVNTPIVEQKKLEITNFSLPAQIFADKTYRSTFMIENKGNTFVWNLPFEIKANGVSLPQSRGTVDVLAPLQKKEITIEYKVPMVSTLTQSQFEVYLDGKKLAEAKTTVLPYYYSTGLKMGVLIISALIVFFILKSVLRKMVTYKPSKK